ncbi:RRP12-like protein isoform X2 [Anneissia japonica]|uniref:RRP12-like protein isoform X1 n=1 Tax=Anneissia japonica TaxID=1529436 RepID=UPI0014258997|nr:RRP12-like protein isoform X1 [Anneissia japonica]XP_033098396.1 RRP12-like protein isoform X2 [Anneissia japonica]
MVRGPGRIKGASTTKKKAKRWKKGQSCVSNPANQSHRQAAVRTRFLPSKPSNRGQSLLTKKSLEKHNENSHGDDVIGDCDMDSEGGHTFGTFMSGLSDCTNPTFDRVKRYWDSQSASHKEVCAVLAAVTEVIREKGGKETETEYFAALMTTLDTVDEDDSRSAVLYLLNLVLKRVPANVIKVKFSMICKCFMEILAQNSNTTSIVRSCLQCLATILRIVDIATWSESSTMQVYHGVLSFTTHQKPKVRKAAQTAICSILRGSQFMVSSRAPPHHPAASQTAKFCIQQVEQCGGTGEATTTLHILGLMKDTLPWFPKQSIKSCCETLLRVMTLSNPLVTSVSMQCLHSLFSSKPKASSLPADLNARIINALYDYQPGSNDAQQMQAWLAVMETAYICLVRLDERLCVSHLPRFTTAAIACFLSDKSEVAVASAKTLKTVLKECVVPSVDWLKIEFASGAVSPVHKMFHTIEGGLAYRYHASWGLVLQVIGTFIEILGKECHHMMSKCLQTMADLRSTNQFPYTVELDKTMGSAVKHMGPKTVLSVVPLHISGDDDNYEFPRSWLIPVMRENICNTELQFFNRYFLPLAAKLRTKSLQLTQAGRGVEAKTYDILQSQIWSLLPGFCKNPTDLCASFKDIARILGSALSDRPDLRKDVCSALRHLIAHNMENEDNKVELARFVKNFLPILFNIYSKSNPKERDPDHFIVFETIKSYLMISDSKLTCNFFDKVCSKLSDKSSEKAAIMDLAIAMVTYVDENRLSSIYKIITKQFEDDDRTVQKKAYRILEEICGSKLESTQRFIDSHLSDLQEVLLKSLAAASPSSKAPRLRCLVQIVKRLPPGQHEFLQAIIPEVMLCTKEINTKARGSAFTLLIETSNAMLRWEPDDRPECLGKFLDLVVAGFAGSPQMISATILSLTRIVYEYKEILTGETLDQMITAMCTLLSSKTREIVRSALGFVKVLLTILDEATLAQFVESLVVSITSLSEPNRRALRKPMKSIYVRLIRKYGYEMIIKLIPADQQKVVHNIKKIQERRKRRRALKDTQEESDDEENEALLPAKSRPETIEEILQESDSDSDDEKDTKKPGGRKVKPKENVKRGAAWLREGKDDTLLDFLDPSVSKRVLATKPEEKSEVKTKVKHNFKSMPDGRLMITDEVNEDVNEKKKGKKKKEVVDELGNLMDKELDNRKMQNRKRKLENLEGISDDEEEMSPSKYKAGGGGIHRPIAVAKRSVKSVNSQPGVEYKAKKAAGDVKRKGKADPYAYVPLNKHLINKRKKASSSGVWKNLTKAAKKGALTGKKGRVQKARKK